MKLGIDRLYLHEEDTALVSGVQQFVADFHIEIAGEQIVEKMGDVTVFAPRLMNAAFGLNFWEPAGKSVLIQFTTLEMQSKPILQLLMRFRENDVALKLYGADVTATIKSSDPANFQETMSIHDFNQEIGRFYRDEFLDRLFREYGHIDGFEESYRYFNCQKISFGLAD